MTDTNGTSLGLANMDVRRERSLRSPGGERQATSRRYFLPREALFAGISKTFAAIDARSLDEAISLLEATRASRRGVYILGNGGSATTASHLACDLSQASRCDGGTPLRSIALTDTARLTACGNDRGFDMAFAETIEEWAEEGDVVIAISVSGNSPNVIKGLLAARATGASTIGLLGTDGGRAIDLVDVALHVAEYDYGLVETVHLGIAHALAVGLRTPT